MRYVAAYVLATLGGKASPSSDDVKAILSSVGIEADEAKLAKVCVFACLLVCLCLFACLCANALTCCWLSSWGIIVVFQRCATARTCLIYLTIMSIKQVLKELNGKDINAVIAEGEKKLASVPSGGAAPAAAAPAAAAKGAEKKEEKKEAKKEEKKEESDADMGFGLFD